MIDMIDFEILADKTWNGNMKRYDFMRIKDIKKLEWDDQSENRGELCALCGGFKASIMLPILSGPVTLNCEYDLGYDLGYKRHLQYSFSDVQKAKRKAQSLFAQYVQRLLVTYCDISICYSRYWKRMLQSFLE